MSYFPEFFAHDLGSLNHRLHFRKRDIARQMEAAAIGQNVDALGGHHFQRLANMLGHHIRRFDIGILHVDHAQAQFERSA